MKRLVSAGLHRTAICCCGCGCSSWYVELPCVAVEQTVSAAAAVEPMMPGGEADFVTKFDNLHDARCCPLIRIGCCWRNSCLLVRVPSCLACSSQGTPPSMNGAQRHCCWLVGSGLLWTMLLIPAPWEGCTATEMLSWLLKLCASLVLSKEDREGAVVRALTCSLVLLLQTSAKYRFIRRS